MSYIEEKSRSIYRGVKCYDINDLAFGTQVKRAAAILDSIELDEWSGGINKLLELYNIRKIILTEGVRPDIVETYKEKVEKINGVLGRNLALITNDTLDEIYAEVSTGIIYIDSFWDVFDMFKVFERIDPETLRELIEQSGNLLNRILQFKKTVQHYNKMLADVMRQCESNEAAEVIISHFMVRDYKGKYFMPEDLKAEDYIAILRKYIDSDYPHIGYLQLLQTAQSPDKFTITDKIRYDAKKKAEALWKERTASSGSRTPLVRFGVSVSFDDIDEIVKCTEDHLEYGFVYDKKWFLENLDYPTLWNNFIYVFQYVDKHSRCTFPVAEAHQSILEIKLGIHGANEYANGIGFKIMNGKSSAEMQAYYEFLKGQEIDIEDLVRWFFVDYLIGEFGINRFVYNPPSPQSTLVEKCRNIASEMDGSFKQYTLYVENGEINRELYEMSSQMVSIERLPSFIDEKYAYCSSDMLRNEMQALFSDQCMLAYVQRFGDKYDSFIVLLIKEEINISDYSEIDQRTINWLAERGSVEIDDDGNLNCNRIRAGVLKDLYDHDVICPYRYPENYPVIEQLKEAGELKFESTLFSRPEADYYNFMLNRAKFENGYDLRNKYIHSTYPMDEATQRGDYMELLKMMVVAVIKMNEEFCYRDEMIHEEKTE